MSSKVTFLRSIDQQAINLLENLGITFTLVDLTESLLFARLKAGISRMRIPTLILNGEEIVGLESIRHELGQIKDRHLK